MNVWVLVFYMVGGTPAVIDNIATMQECVRIKELLPEQDRIRVARCIEVKKAHSWNNLKPYA